MKVKWIHLALAVAMPSFAYSASTAPAKGSSYRAKSPPALWSECHNGDKVACYYYGWKMDVKGDETNLSYGELHNMVEAYKMACNQRFADACTNLAVLYGPGNSHLGYDLDELIRWYSKACDWGDRLGCKYKKINENVLNEQNSRQNQQNVIVTHTCSGGTHWDSWLDACVHM